MDIKKLLIADIHLHLDGFKIEKEYIAIVDGKMEKNEDIFEDYICDLLFISQFRQPANFISINKYEDGITSNTVISYKLPLDVIYRIVVDKK